MKKNMLYILVLSAILLQASKVVAGYSVTVNNNTSNSVVFNLGEDSFLGTCTETLSATLAPGEQNHYLTTNGGCCIGSITVNGYSPDPNKVGTYWTACETRPYAMNYPSDFILPTQYNKYPVQPIDFGKSANPV